MGCHAGNGSSGPAGRDWTVVGSAEISVCRTDVDTIRVYWDLLVRIKVGIAIRRPSVGRSDAEGAYVWSSGVGIKLYAIECFVLRF